MQELTSASSRSKAKSKIGLGTVQFGLSYGVTNHHGKTSIEEARRIIICAGENGISTIDTASAYGDAEAVLGQTLPPQHDFEIITKIPDLTPVPKSKIEKHVRHTLLQSLKKMQQPSLHGVMLHCAENLKLEQHGAIISALEALKRDGLVKKIGVSAYTQAELEHAFSLTKFDLVQVPVNILDQRLLQSGYLDDLKHSGVEIHARSAFLQGLLLLPSDQLPSFFDPIRAALSYFERRCQEMSISRLQCALNFVLNQSCIDRVICGFNTLSQFNEAIEASCCSVEEFPSISIENERFLNPALWRL